MATKRDSIHPFDLAITPERIAERAYFLYLERGCADGHDLEDWLRAEAQLAAESLPTTPTLTVVADDSTNGRRTRSRRTTV